MTQRCCCPQTCRCRKKVRFSSVHVREYGVLVRRAIKEQTGTIYIQRTLNWFYKSTDVRPIDEFECSQACRCKESPVLPSLPLPRPRTRTRLVGGLLEKYLAARERKLSRLRANRAAHGQRESTEQPAPKKSYMEIATPDGNPNYMQSSTSCCQLQDSERPPKRRKAGG